MSRIELQEPLIETKLLPYEKYEYQYHQLNKKIGIGISVAFIFYMIVGTIVYAYAESWTPVEAIYFCVGTFTTSGLGDYVPTHDGTKLFTCIYILFGFSIVSFLLGSLAQHILRKQEKIIVAALKNPEKDEVRIQRRKQLLIATSILTFSLIFAIVGIYYTASETIDIPTAIYGAFGVFSTVGYGDVKPGTDSARVLWTFFSLFGTFMFATTIGLAVDYLVLHKQRKLTFKLWRHARETQNLNFVSFSGKVNNQAFLELMLIKHHQVKPQVIADINRKFRTLDVNGSGWVSEEVLRKFEEDDRL